MTTATTAAAPSRADNTLHGVLFMMAGLLILSSTDGVVKYLSDFFSPLTVSFFRFAVQLVIILALAPFYKRTWRSLLQETTIMLFVRGLLLAVGSIFIVFALKYLPLTDATAIFFIQPVFLVIFSAMFLKEQVGMKRWLAVFLGFAGVLIIIRPGTGVFQPAALLPLAAAISFACYLMLTRKLSGQASQLAIQFATGFAGTLLILPILVFAWLTGFGGELVVSHPTDSFTLPITFLLGIGGTGLIAHVLLVKAFERAPASLLAPVNYIEIFSATLIGYLVFNEVPDEFIWVGVFLLFSSGIILAHAERKPKSSHS
ncbi:DMT family transporter [Pseudovibrio sp. Tun.PSC04-5.I4]|uniref:DMT family transporter n=1 Tax=Pseudovibrio sp. Tun.PSC04-5.I4 TaxID=1798213 RepID=UPI0008918BFD|nr:DMT family transporter [Pseudovibrio sp. Tun.PSC04-5.I4]SDQ78877.1 EamA domain-containing membrane protein RarD [Pseudovibrio sp. Tun.PSC04-5.I4]